LVYDAAEHFHHSNARFGFQNLVGTYRLPTTNSQIAEYIAVEASAEPHPTAQITENPHLGIFTFNSICPTFSGTYNETLEWGNLSSDIRQQSSHPTISLNEYQGLFDLGMNSTVMNRSSSNWAINARYSAAPSIIAAPDEDLSQCAGSSRFNIKESLPQRTALDSSSSNLDRVLYARFGVNHWANCSIASR
jgi:hypothetical protein